MRHLRKGQRGASLVELMFAVAIGAITVVALVRFVGRANGAMTRSESTNAMIASNQRLLQNAHNTLLSTVELVTNYDGGSPDTSGLQAIINASITASGSPAPVSFTVMPTVMNAKEVNLNSGPVGTSFGNALYMVVSLPPVSFTVSVNNLGNVVYPPSATPASTDSNYVMRLGRLQYVAIYLTQDTTKTLKGGIRPLRLVEWRSKPYVLYDPLKDLLLTPGAKLTGTCQTLVGLSYTVAVDGSRSLSTAIGGGYYSIAATGVITNIAAPSTLGRNSWAYLDEYQQAQDFAIHANEDNGRVATNRSSTFVTGPTLYSIAYNNVSPTVSPAYKVTALTGRSLMNGPINVPAYAQADLNGVVGFPGGFEVAIVGRSGAREVFLRVVQMASNGSTLSVREAAKEYLAVESTDFTSVGANN